MGTDSSSYGLWLLVIINTLIFVVFAFSFTHPRTARDWRSFGAFSAFVVALFTEMYGFPLTIYLLSGWLGDSYPVADPLSHNNGHLWEAVFGWGGDPHLNPIHLVSGILVGGGVIIVAYAWPVLHRAQQHHELATSGLYARVRHPQYVGFVLVMAGFLMEWPTIVTAAMFPVLLFMYARLSKREEGEAAAEFGDEYVRYAAVTPRFIPRLDLSIGRPKAQSR